MPQLPRARKRPNHRRTERHTSTMSGESPISPDSAGIPFFPPLIYVAGYLLGVVLEFAISTADLPSPLAIAIGIVGIVVWVALDPAAMRKFRQAGTEVPPTRPTTALVRAGPYRFSRNPMYLGMLILYAALALAFGVLWAMALLPVVFLVLDRLVVPREEAYLERKFGDDYLTYRAQVRRWL
jgi:protein-S-isoprenylcysteine O-methyltransferase Ste14